MVKGIRLHCHCHWGLPLSSTTFVHTRVYQLRYILKYSIYIIQFSIFISVEWMWIMGSEYKFFKVVVCASSVWFDSILFNLYYTVHCQPATILTFSFVAKWRNQRDRAPGSVHYLGQLNFEKIEAMWHILLIFLDGILAQKMLIYIAADTLYWLHLYTIQHLLDTRVARTRRRVPNVGCLIFLFLYTLVNNFVTEVDSYHQGW
jgi:hypothetical protein